MIAEVFPFAIPLRRRDGEVLYALVDAASYDTVRRYRWHIVRMSNDDYVVREGSRKEGAPRRVIRLAREVLGLAADDPRFADHRNGNTLDNRRCNLRPATNGENQQNRAVESYGRSRIRGAVWDGTARRWQARVRLDGVLHYLGLHDSAEQAGRVAAEFRRAHMPLADRER